MEHKAHEIYEELEKLEGVVEHESHEGSDDEHNEGESQDFMDVMASGNFPDPYSLILQTENSSKNSTKNQSQKATLHGKSRIRSTNSGKVDHADVFAKISNIMKNSIGKNNRGETGNVE